MGDTSSCDDVLGHNEDFSMNQGVVGLIKDEIDLVQEGELRTSLTDAPDPPTLGLAVLSPSDGPADTD